MGHDSLSLGCAIGVDAEGYTLLTSLIHQIIFFAASSTFVVHYILISFNYKSSNVSPEQ